MTWVTPTNVSDGVVWEADDFNDMVVGNLLHLYNGNPLAVWSPAQDLSQNYAPSANDAIGFPFIAPASGDMAGLSYLVGTSGGNVDVGLYEDAGDDLTCTKLKTNGGAALGAAGVRTTTYTAAQALIPGEKYWLWIALSSAAARLKGTDGPTAVFWKKMASAYPLPNTITFGATPSIVPALFATLT